MQLNAELKFVMISTKLIMNRIGRWIHSFSSMPPAAAVIVLVGIVSLFASCNKTFEESEEGLNEYIELKAIAHDLDFKIKNEQLMLDLVLRRFGSLSQWKDFIVSSRNAESARSNAVSISSGAMMSSSLGYKLTVVDQLGFSYTPSANIPFDMTISDFLTINGINVEPCDGAGVGDACVSKIVSGQVDQSNQSFLYDCHLEQGYILPCVGYCLSDATILLSTPLSTNCEEPIDESYDFGPSCKATDNLNLTADSFISQCRKASIRSVFPDELLFKTLGQIKVGTARNYKTAWKLLNDSRFAK